jgi:predicted acyltransferase (DUF342 family)
MVLPGRYRKGTSWSAGKRLVNQPVRAAPKETIQGTLRSWRVSILRQGAQVLGSVKAKDERAAEAAAVAEFILNDEQRQRLAVREE